MDSGAQGLSMLNGSFQAVRFDNITFVVNNVCGFNISAPEENLLFHKYALTLEVFILIKTSRLQFPSPPQGGNNVNLEEHRGSKHVVGR